MDIEGRPLVENPYGAGGSAAASTQNAAINKIVVNLQRLVYMGISLYGLHQFDAYKAVFQSPQVSHEWFKVGLAATIGTRRLERVLHRKAFCPLQDSTIATCV
jgi:hypothetical protein